MAKNKKASNDVIGLDVQLSKSEAFIEKHLKLILAILAVVVIVVSGIFIYRHYMSNQTAEANVNAGLAAANQIVDYFATGNTRFQVNK